MPCTLYKDQSEDELAQLPRENRRTWRKSTQRIVSTGDDVDVYYLYQRAKHQQKCLVL